MVNNVSRLNDQYHRRLNYLRISITDRCNLRCLYCIPRKSVAKLDHGEILTYEEILRLAGIAARLGVDKVRLTGGEPLVRKGVLEFIARLTAIPGLKDVSLTTNGINLKDKLDSIRSAGIKRINVSLDTLRRERFKQITGYDAFQEVWENIELARKMNFHPIKINAVVMKGLNDDEVPDLVRLSKTYPYHIRFIEYMPIAADELDTPLEHVPSSELKEMVSGLGELIPVSPSSLDGPAQRFRFKGAPGEIGFISPLTQHFCSVCNRLRLTARGRLRSCLLSDHEEDLKGPMRRGVPDSELEEIFIEAARNKPSAHRLTSENQMTASAPMKSIGG